MTLRHTAITRLAEALHSDKHRKELTSWAGHSDRTMADVYTRVGVDFDGTEMSAVADSLVSITNAEVIPIRRST